jgi:phage shock protein PspC (stress-responsive transcriptional regulator)
MQMHNTRLCPYCAEEIYADATSCCYCLSSLRQPQNHQEWYRTENKKILAGVCQGLSDYFHIPVLAVRLAFIIATIFGGWGLFIYICLWLLMPVTRRP